MLVQTLCRLPTRAKKLLLFLFFGWEKLQPRQNKNMSGTLAVVA